MWKQANFFYLAVVTTGCFVSGGCALTTDKVTFDYSPQNGAAPIQGAASKNLTVAVSDERADKADISHKKNGFGMEMAPIVSDKPIEEVFKSAIESELRVRGFRLGGGKSVNVTVDRFYNDFKVGFWSGDGVGQVEMRVSIGSYQRSIKTDFQHTIMVAGGDNVKESLDGALHKALAELFADQKFISALLK